MVFFRFIFPFFVLIVPPLVHAERVRFTAGVGVQLSAEYAPAKSPGLPAVLLLDGCEHAQATNKNIQARVDRMSGLLQEMGYAVLYLDGYLAKGKQRTHCIRSKNAPQNLTLSDLTNDAEAAISWLQSHTKIDRQRIGVLGWSQGSDVLLELMTRMNLSIKAAVAYYPSCKWVSDKKNYRVSAPTLVLAGEGLSQDMVQNCYSLAQKSGQSLFYVVSYPDFPFEFDFQLDDLDPDETSDRPAKEKRGNTLVRSQEAIYDAHRRTFKWFSRWFDPERAIKGVPPVDLLAK